MEGRDTKGRFTIGNTGRPKGSGNKYSAKVKSVIADALGEVGADTILEKLIDIEDPKDFIVAYTKLAEFIEPKMRSVDMPQIDHISNPVIDVIKKIQNEAKNEK